jgi:PleD family two-component response regulator
MIQTSKTTENSDLNEMLGVRREKIPVLIIGNNPIEMTSFYNMLIGNPMKHYLADVCFDVKDSFIRINRQKPDVILIDDNLFIDDINKLIRVLNQNTKTKSIKIIVLKSSNWNYNVIDNVNDYVLKDTINGNVLDQLIQKNLLQAEYQYA